MYPQQENYSEKRKVLVVGGAIGTFLAAKLHAVGHQVDFVGGRKIAHLKNTVRIQERAYAIPIPLQAIPAEENYDVAILATKLHHLPDLLTVMKDVRLSAQKIVSIQNGLVDNTPFEEILNGQKILIASVFDGFRLDGQRLLTTNTGRGWKVEDSPDGRYIAALLSQANIPCESEPNLQLARTEKSIVNCCLNGLSAIYNKTFTELFEDKDLSARIELLFDECYKILSAGLPLEAAETLKIRLFRDWRYADHYSSMWQDVCDGKTTEIDFLNGYMIDLGKKHRLPIKENQKIVSELKEIVYKRQSL